MKKIILITLALAVVSCNPQSSEKKVEQLKKYKQKVMALDNQITRLEQELKADSVLNGSNAGYVLVELKQLSPENFRHYIEVSGDIEMEQEAFISSEMNGQIEKIHMKEGDRVRQGQLLMALNTDMVRSSMEEVKTGLELAEKLFEKQEELWKQGIGTEIQYLQAKNNYESARSRLSTLEVQLEMSLIRAPFEGIVDRIYKKEGELAVPGMQLLQLVNLGNLIVRAQVSESYLMQVKKGEMVEIRFPSYTGKIVEAPITRTGNVIDESSRTFEIEIKMPNQGGIFKPNQMVVVRIRDFESENALVIPSVIIKKDIRGLYVYTASPDENGALVARKAYVTAGLSYEDKTMVTSGLEAGQKVIISGYNMVSDGILLKVAGKGSIQ